MCAQSERSYLVLVPDDFDGCVRAARSPSRAAPSFASRAGSGTCSATRTPSSAPPRATADSGRARAEAGERSSRASPRPSAPSMRRSIDAIIQYEYIHSRVLLTVGYTSTVRVEELGSIRSTVLDSS